MFFRFFCNLDFVCNDKLSRKGNVVYGENTN